MIGRPGRPRVFLVVLLGISILAALTGVAFHWLRLERTLTYFTDGASIRFDARRAPVRDVLWQPPVPLTAGPNALDKNKDDNQYEIEGEAQISADGRTLFLVRGRPTPGAFEGLARERLDARVRHAGREPQCAFHGPGAAVSRDCARMGRPQGRPD